MKFILIKLGQNVAKLSPQKRNFLILREIMYNSFVLVDLKNQ